jgi:hypothetical protein
VRKGLQLSVSSSSLIKKRLKGLRARPIIAIP